MSETLKDVLKSLGMAVVIVAAFGFVIGGMFLLGWLFGPIGFLVYAAICGFAMLWIWLYEGLQKKRSE